MNEAAFLEEQKRATEPKEEEDKISEKEENINS